MKLDNLNGKCNDPSNDWAMTVQWPGNDPAMTWEMTQTKKIEDVIKKHDRKKDSKKGGKWIFPRNLTKCMG